MVTITKIGEEYNSQILEISGLSTDPKPVDQIDGVSIANGSTFKEIDTGKEYTYNESAETWHINKSASSGGGSGVDGEDGGYYTPGVTQPTTDTMQISFAPSKSDMPAVDPVTVNLPVSENSGQNPVQSDLSQNDPTQPDYVKHRTHYEENNQTVIEWDGDTEGLDSLEIGGFMCYKVSDLLPTEEGITGGELVFSTGESMPVATENIDVGDGCFLVAELVVVMQNTHATVAGFSLEAPSTGMYFARVSADTYTASLAYGSTVVHPLDEKFIPASIARKTDIPSDDHINDLINTALGVIENGTY